MLGSNENKSIKIFEGTSFSRKGFGDMFHVMFVFNDMFTICISPDLDGNSAPKTEISRCLSPPDMFHESRYVCHPPIRFTICLFISPDLDGHRAPYMRQPNRCDEQVMTITPHDMFHDMFVHLLNTICFHDMFVH